jgi:hypothetical protein
MPSKVFPVAHPLFVPFCSIYLPAACARVRIPVVHETLCLSKLEGLSR